MTQFEVHLARTERFQFREWDIDLWKYRTDEDFDHVALIEARNERAAWKKCQHDRHDGPWQEGDHVLEASGDNIRSLSTGDVLFEVEGTPTANTPRKVHIIRPIGMEAILASELEAV